MRISTGQIQQTMLGSLQNNYRDFGRLQQQMSSGKKILQPSDDPIGAVKLIGLQKEQASLTQFKANISMVKTQLSQGEVQMESMSNVLLRMQDLTQMAANGSYGDDEREAMAVELRQLQDSLVDLANARDENGSYLFSGSEVKTAPIAKDAAGNYVYQGDGYQRDVMVAQGVSIAANDTAADMFFANGDFFNQMDALLSELDNPTGQGAALASAMLDQLSATQQSVTRVQSGVGARINTLDQLDESHDEQKLFSQEVSNQIEALDYSAAATELSNVLLSLQVTQQAYGKVNNLSLFNYL
ncbi:flagellar hook-associated protein FlgL [Pseudaeromonas sharmana]|uniref:Flagellar hook-associated protein FlgL n=1 Tax=Pseudaeromonas sharmana TaxID=328412 RepID=A0ABV8CMN3_9GAMM